MFKNLSVKKFRNFEEATIQFSPKVNIFLGDNGQGKSNLLEALYILSSGDSFRYADNENLLKFGEKEARILGKRFQKNLDYEIQLDILKSRKTFFQNGKKATAAEIHRNFYSVIFSPESLSTIKEGADQRRQLVDEYLVSFDPNNADLLHDFKHALKTRNKVLKNLLEGQTGEKEAIDILESLEPQYLELAAKLTFQRILALRGLIPDFQHSFQRISQQNVEITVDYVISGENAANWDQKSIQNSLQKRLQELRKAELSSGVSLVGPQKHDIIFLYNGKDSRFYCSQGQQRALILAYKMAQIVYHHRVHGVYPVLLLDDVLSELDLQKREALIKFLAELNTQIFITTTDLNLPEDMRADDCKVIRVSEGRVE